MIFQVKNLKIESWVEWKKIWEEESIIFYYMNQIYKKILSFFIIYTFFLFLFSIDFIYFLLKSIFFLSKFLNFIFFHDFKTRFDII